MSLRITPTRQIELGTARANDQAAAVADLRNQISSGVRISRPSDDPRGQELVLDQLAVIGQLEARSEVIDETRFILNEANTQIRNANDLVVRARDITLQANQLTTSVEAEAFASEIDTLLDSLGGIANTRQSGRYLFSGTNLQTPPFGDVSNATNYEGSQIPGTTFIGGTGDIQTFYSGLDVFTTGQGGQTTVFGTTGIQGGTGTATGIGSSELLVSHVSTSFDGASGIQPGLSSASGDTVIGPLGQSSVEIIDTSGTGAFGTISLNGGSPVAFTSADNDLLVTGASGEQIYVDTTAIAAGTNGHIDLQADGQISLDDGASFTAIDFSANQLVTDPDGNLRYFDTREVQRTGTGEVELSGSTDIFHQLRNLRDDLVNFNELSTEERQRITDDNLGALDQTIDHLLGVVGQQSIDLEQLDTQQTRSEDIQADAQVILSDLQSTDLTSAVVELQELELLNQFTLATLARAFDTSILDFL
ncbi:MAG: flagellar hook-associated protein FlgL [Fuerstiella sp.]